MTDTTAEIRSKKAGNTGLTEEIAKKFADAESGHLLAIVEMKVVTVHKDVDSGDRKVDFVITGIEPVDPLAEDHVRSLQRAHFMNRKLHSEDQTLPIPGTAGDNEPTIEGVLSARAKFEPHEYVDTADAICDVCGEPAGAGLHQVLTDDDEPDSDVESTDSLGVSTTIDEPEPTAEATTTPDPWEYSEPEGTDTKTVKDPFVTT